MKIKTIAVTTDSFFLTRHKFLYQALATHWEKVVPVACGDPSPFGPLNRFLDLTYRAGTRLSQTTASRLFQCNPRMFVARSRMAQRKLQSMSPRPDLAFHVFGMFGPSWDEGQTPYVMYLDYTTSLAARSYPKWAPFANAEQFERWKACERHVYSRAQLLFPMSELVKRSLVQDYGISEDRIRVVGCSGNFQHPHEGGKTFGRRQILFNGTDFDRKGGNLVIDAFREVRRRWPDATLLILGKGNYPSAPGVHPTGFISSHEKLEQIFMDTDLVVAPGYCDPFPAFLIEAMNYGIPTIVSSRDGMPEIVDHGVTGVVLQELTAAALAGEMARLLSDPATLQAMSQAAKEKVRTKLNWTNISAAIAGELAAL